MNFVFLICFPNSQNHAPVDGEPGEPFIFEFSSFIIILWCNLLTASSLGLISKIKQPIFLEIRYATRKTIKLIILAQSF